ncbi:integrase catalytic domain-containing protein [Trichonephila clavipes]|uniref:Integrase catalytic domain-containing protein n=1 Tax=Trichonephila clavipes TaxID=2585209 RepID=A0A8X6WJ33_TRICX|nr:integrase catalytic domain-containing protein [Trichonephila clavipes]
MCSHSCRTLRTCVGHVHKVFFTSLRRFLARRGNCKVIYSDNARTFTAAERELAYFANILKDSEFQNFVADKALRKSENGANKRSGESSHQEIRKLLIGEELGDRRPSELLRVMRRRAESHSVPDDLMLELFSSICPLVYNPFLQL